MFLVDDVYSAMKPLDTRLGCYDFLSKLRRLLSVIEGSKVSALVTSMPKYIQFLTGYELDTFKQFLRAYGLSIKTRRKQLPT